MINITLGEKSLEGYHKVGTGSYFSRGSDTDPGKLHPEPQLFFKDNQFLV